ncbi:MULTISPECIES: 1-deoxy-D-xylulose-5-phosphate synthase [Kosmotoga]|uniref:1-deoxy-D-xylulose-5-phosphate synthase n=1 Tax=Kosmotoga olearia (strain ATCC BAA-1733 / DSM 21960 / TBF 19.5.1) TaxID=521045 RepID=C5CI87_KOSOT|nr:MULTISPECIES: 1-deoxy-D-xylulose-5-phosphate synthase [Kosmotoga]ACR80789.1 deoxyxylulose-5-phosphate synthase [Kosmotoga olearia TBF 19.5.1]OAA19233.1 1-deoxy-D-xylulose-5-phosphate synthase [Kosmotoga sp. DU53]
MIEFDEVPLYKKIKGYSYPELEILAEEFRNYIANVVSKNTGHLASNLGTIELTFALYRVFDPEKDIIIWDTGHQAYSHKLLTGRFKAFKTLRQRHGISGFTKRDESKYDVFGAGHVGTAIPAALGIEQALKLRNEKRNIVVVVGDGALTSGISLEALNQIRELSSKIKIVVNDNGMSISRNVGSLSTKLNEFRLNPIYRELKEDLKSALETMRLSKIENILSKLKSGVKHSLLGGNIFEDLGLNYIGPINGHNIREMEGLFKMVKNFDEPFLIHVVTKKGAGLDYAEKDPTTFHSVSRIDPETGQKITQTNMVSYSRVFGSVLAKLGELDPRIVAVTAAMPDGTGLAEFARKFPERFFDLGITEQLCTTFAAGIATKNLKPVFAVYSTFLQRSFDQLIHDVALQRLPVVFAIDRAGIVGRDGPTHNGIFDIAYLSMIPNMRVLAPSNLQELANIVCTILSDEEISGPIAIRYPRQSEIANLEEILNSMMKINVWKWEKLFDGKEVAILAVGSMVSPAKQVAEKHGYTLYNCRSVKPLDEVTLAEVLKKHDLVVCIEEGVKIGGFGSSVMLYASDHGFSTRVVAMGVEDRFSEHGSREEILSELFLDSRGIEKRIFELRGERNANNDRVRKD